MTKYKCLDCLAREQAAAREQAVVGCPNAEPCCPEAGKKRVIGEPDIECSCECHEDTQPESQQ